MVIQHVAEMEASQFASVLVVEDDVLLRLELSDELRHAGFIVIEARNGDEAKVLLESATQIDLVCTDIRMPGKLNGIELARWIKQQRPTLPVIVLSGEVTGRELSTSADAKFTKPVDLPRLLQTLRRLLPKFSHAAGPQP